MTSCSEERRRIIADRCNTVNGNTRVTRHFFTRSYDPCLLGKHRRNMQGETGRGERIRTSGLYVPNVALYQAKLHPESAKNTGAFRVPVADLRQERELARDLEGSLDRPNAQV